MGISTINGMGFGYSDRMKLISSSSPLSLPQQREATRQQGRRGRATTKTTYPAFTTTTSDSDSSLLLERRSYNEIMLEHRTIRIPSWHTSSSSSRSNTEIRSTQKQQEGRLQRQNLQQRRQRAVVVREEAAAQPTTLTTTTSSSIHDVLESLRVVWRMQDAAQNYQWNTIRATIRSYPLSDLSEIMIPLRQIEINSRRNSNSGSSAVVNYMSTTSSIGNGDLVIGFDWSSCSWRHCGALADIQETVDELDQLLGVLEPNEVLFCLDIIERSIRDVLTVIPWDTDVAYSADYDYYKHHVQPYKSKIWIADEALQREVDPNSITGDPIEDTYLHTLQTLKILN